MFLDKAAPQYCERREAGQHCLEGAPGPALESRVSGAWTSQPPAPPHNQGALAPNPWASTQPQSSRDPCPRGWASTQPRSSRDPPRGRASTQPRSSRDPPGAGQGHRLAAHPVGRRAEDRRSPGRRLKVPPLIGAHGVTMTTQGLAHSGGPCHDSRGPRFVRELGKGGQGRATMPPLPHTPDAFTGWQM